MVNETTPNPRTPTRLRVPFLITCGMAFMAFFAGVAGIIIPLFVAIALFSRGPFTVNGAPVTRSEFLLTVAPILGAMVPVAVTAGLFAWGVWKERPWTREVAIGFWALCLVISIGQVAFMREQRAEAVQGLVSTLILILVALWYFYVKGNVVTYYRDLANLKRAA